jgi:hypothetical protein
MCAGYCRAGRGNVLITTRRGGFRDLGGLLDLDAFDRAEAIAVLCRRAPVLSGARVDVLAERLAGLLLALVQAAACLAQTGMPPEQYLDLLRERAAEVHTPGPAAGPPGIRAFGHHRHCVVGLGPGAAGLLPGRGGAAEVAGVAGPGPLPVDVFAGCPGRLPGRLPPSACRTRAAGRGGADGRVLLAAYQCYTGYFYG